MMKIFPPIEVWLLCETSSRTSNLSPCLAIALIGKELYDEVSSKAIQLYKEAADYAITRGLILADTKFEFGLITNPQTGAQQVILIDELLTPDSSRYWPAAEYTPGRGQASFDKQFLRNWLTANGFRKGLESGPEGHEGEGWVMDQSVVDGTRQRYVEAYSLLTGAQL